MSPDTDRPKGLDRGELLTLAHELRGALTVIAGYTDLLKRPLEASAQEAALEGIGRAVQRADRLIEDALLGGEGGADRVRPLDLAALAERVADEQRAATHRDIEVRALARPQVAGDPDALSRLLGNLVDNAAKYSSTASAVEIEIDASEGLARLTVLDRGPGIAEKDRERAFERFERLDPDSGVMGTGVGLAVVGDIATSHGGTASIDSRPGGGASISVTLPAL